MVRATSEAMGDDSVVAATGKTPDEWFALLDAAGATAWTHRQIVERLDGEGVPAWWRQNVTVRYEQARGMRLPGQRADGTFEVNKSRSVALGQHDALDAIIAVIAGELGPPASESRSATYLRARWKLGGTEALLASADPPKGDKTPLVLTHSGLGVDDDLDAVRARLAAWLAQSTAV